MNRAATREAIAAEAARREAATARRLEEIEALLARPYLGDTARAALTREYAALRRRHAARTMH